VRIACDADHRVAATMERTKTRGAKDRVRYSACLRNVSPARIFPALNTAPAESFRRDARVIGVVSLAHGVSHFLQLALPPLFPLLRTEFDVSWTLLGFVAGVFYVASGIVQFGAGFVVDRLGARPVLLAGMALLACGTLAAALAPNPWWLFPCAALMGAGNGVFHPSDFAILNANVSARRLGHAYSTHGVGGNLGYALAPIVSFGIGAAFGWRVALAGMGLVGLIVLGVLASQRRILTSHRAPDAHRRSCSASATSCSRRPQRWVCRRSCRPRSTPDSRFRSSSPRRR
jgi:MFS transporter, FSR family, fosmidomycin resistance protein